MVHLCSLCTLIVALRLLVHTRVQVDTPIPYLWPLPPSYPHTTPQRKLCSSPSLGDRYPCLVGHPRHSNPPPNKALGYSFSLLTLLNPPIILVFQLAPQSDPLAPSRVWITLAAGILLLLTKFDLTTGSEAPQDALLILWPHHATHLWSVMLHWPHHLSSPYSCVGMLCARVLACLLNEPLVLTLS